MPTARLTVYIAESLDTRLRIYAAYHRLSLSELVESAIAQKLNQLETDSQSDENNPLAYPDQFYGN